MWGTPADVALALAACHCGDRSACDTAARSLSGKRSFWAPQGIRRTHGAGPLLKAAQLFCGGRKQLGVDSEPCKPGRTSGGLQSHPCSTAGCSDLLWVSFECLGGSRAHRLSSSTHWFSLELVKASLVPNFTRSLLSCPRALRRGARAPSPLHPPTLVLKVVFSPAASLGELLSEVR